MLVHVELTRKGGVEVSCRMSCSEYVGKTKGCDQEMCVDLHQHDVDVLRGMICGDLERTM